MGSVWGKGSLPRFPCIAAGGLGKGGEGRAVLESAEAAWRQGINGGGGGAREILWGDGSQLWLEGLTWRSLLLAHGSARQQGF